MSLRLAGAGYRYPGATLPALTGIDLELRPNAVIGIVGASEAGKSTLCLVAAGLAPAAIGGAVSGLVTIDELDTSTAPMHQLAQRCGILFQQPATQISGTEPTVWEEVALGPRNLSLPPDDLIQRTWAALDALALTDLAARDPDRLSGGQQQLVALAGVLAMRPAYLVLDEPTAQLDPAGTSLVGRAIAGLRVSGHSILIAEQKTDLLEALCDEVVVLEAGRVALQGRAETVFADERLEAWGVEPPAAERLRRYVAAAGLFLELPS